MPGSLVRWKIPNQNRTQSLLWSWNNVECLFRSHTFLPLEQIDLLSYFTVTQISNLKSGKVPEGNHFIWPQICLSFLSERLVDNCLQMYLVPVTSCWSWLVFYTRNNDLIRKVTFTVFVAFWENLLYVPVAEFWKTAFFLISFWTIFEIFTF